MQVGDLINCEQYWGLMTHVACPAVEIRTRTFWAGLPSRRSNEDHGPSVPSLLEESSPISIRCIYRDGVELERTNIEMVAKKMEKAPSSFVVHLA